MRLSNYLFFSFAALLLMSLLAGPAYAGAYPTDFSKLDRDNDAQVSFSEYKTYADKTGLSTTEAAQDFVRAAQGDAILTEEELTFALSMQGKPYGLQSMTPPAHIKSYGPQPLTEVQNVEEEPIYGYETIPRE